VDSRRSVGEDSADDLGPHPRDIRARACGVEHWQRGAHVDVSAVSERGWPVGPARQLVEPARAAVGIGPRGGKMHLVPEMK
jgi:hypothetical protein